MPTAFYRPASYRLYRRPNSTYVARFVGRTNLIPVTIKERIVDTQGYVLTREDVSDASCLSAEGVGLDLALGHRCFLGFRPEDASLRGDLANRVQATVEKVTYVGDGWLVACKSRMGDLLHVSIPTTGTVPVPGEAVAIGWPPNRSIMIDDVET